MTEGQTDDGSDETRWEGKVKVKVQAKQGRTESSISPLERSHHEQSLLLLLLLLPPSLLLLRPSSSLSPPQSSVTEQNSAEQHREQKHSIRNGARIKIRPKELIRTSSASVGILEGVASGQHQMRAIDFNSPGKRKIIVQFSQPPSIQRHFVLVLLPLLFFTRTVIL